MLIGAADEVLTELKSEKSKDLAKRSEVESMLGKLEDSKYFFLCNLSKKITDYQSQSAKQMDDDDVGDIDEYGVNVDIGESDESEQEDLNYVSFKLKWCL